MSEQSLSSHGYRISHLRTHFYLYSYEGGRGGGRGEASPSTHLKNPNSNPKCPANSNQLQPSAIRLRRSTVVCNYERWGGDEGDVMSCAESGDVLISLTRVCVESARRIPLYTLEF